MNSGKNSKNKHGPLRDFTLTNVRQTAKLNDIKIAIEKLKGYKLECQRLTLVDEAEITNSGYSQNIILQPIKQKMMSDPQRKVNGKSVRFLSPSEVEQASLEEAKSNYLRLRDDFTLDYYNIL